MQRIKKWQWVVGSIMSILLLVSIIGAVVHERGKGRQSTQVPQVLILSPTELATLCGGQKPVQGAVSVGMDWSDPSHKNSSYVPDEVVAMYPGGKELVLDRGAFPVLSPDGTTVAYQAGWGEGDIKTIRIDGTQKRTLVQGLQNAFELSSPFWTPDGRVIFSVLNSDHWALGLSIVDPATHRVEPVRGGMGQMIDLSLMTGDSETMLYSSGWNVYLLESFKDRPSSHPVARIGPYGQLRGWTANGRYASFRTDFNEPQIMVIDTSLAPDQKPVNITPSARHRTRHK